MARRVMVVGLLLSAYVLFFRGESEELAPAEIALMGRYERLQDGGLGCVAWRATAECDPEGLRIGDEDLSCSEEITIDSYTSGFCECEGGRKLGEHPCATSLREHLHTVFRPHPFTCARVCAGEPHAPDGASESRELSLALPVRPVVAGLCLEALTEPMPMIWERAPAVVAPGGAGSPLRKMWNKIDDGLDFAHALAGAVPGPRTPLRDFVEGRARLSPAQVEEAREQLWKFQRHLPSFGDGGFVGRGVVMVGGGLGHMAAAWVSLHMLRRVGCALPVEMWFETHQVPTRGVVDMLAGLGVQVRHFDEICLGCSHHVFRDARAKAAAVLFSSFQEVVYLGDDVIAVEDPAVLFNAEGTGALLWPGVGPRSVSPDFWSIAGVDAGTWAAGAHDTGQMVIDKQRLLGALVIAIYMNIQGTLFWRLLGDSERRGGEETFAYGMAVRGVPYHRVGYAPGSVGVLAEEREGSHSRLLHNTLAHYHPEGGRIMFLRMEGFRWQFDVPYHFAEYPRRWRWLQHNLTTPHEQWVEAGHELEARAGVDLEKVAFGYLLALKCSPFFGKYVRERIYRFGDAAPLEVSKRSFPWVSAEMAAPLGEHAPGEGAGAEAGRERGALRGVASLRGHLGGGVWRRRVSRRRRQLLAQGRALE